MSVNEIIQSIIDTEGGYQNHREDGGNYADGRLLGTKFGITPAALAHYRGVDPADLAIEDMLDLTREEAAKIYERDYFKSPGVDKLPAQIQRVMADMVVNHGAPTAIKLLQRTLSLTPYTCAADGVIGPKTIRAAAEAQALMGHLFNDAIVWSRIAFYKELVRKRPAFEKFLNGWLSRAHSHFVQKDWNAA